MAGYFGDPAATAAVLGPDGWLDTGDMGYLADGYIYVVGRAKDMIIINGKNHWPQDIEWAIEQLPGFKAGDIAAFSITTPGGEEAPAVLVQCRTSCLAERSALRDAIRVKVRAITGMSCVVELVPAADAAAHVERQAEPVEGAEPVSVGRDSAVRDCGVILPPSPSGEGPGVGLSSETLQSLDQSPHPPAPAPEGEGAQKVRSPLTLAVTGGTGFVGRHLLRLATGRGHVVRALTRSPQPEQPGITWISGTLIKPRALCDGVDAVIHVAGVVNARNPLEFHTGNVAGTAAMLNAAAAAGVRRFVHVSSIAAREPALSHYGASKAAAEALVAASGLDWVMIRPPAVYGPGDADMLAVYRLIARGIAVVPRGGRFSLIEAGDLAAALLDVTAGEVGGPYEIDDGRPHGYSHADLARLIGAALGREPRLLQLSAAALRTGAAFDTARGWIVGDLPRLSFDRARYLAHPDWVVTPGIQLPPDVWQPRVTAVGGIAATAAWYRAQGWLR